MVKKRTVTIIETRQVRLIRRPKNDIQAWCGECAATSRMITPETAAHMSQVSVRTIYRWAETGKAHFMETSDGRLFICADSLNP